MSYAKPFLPDPLCSLFFSSEAISLETFYGTFGIAEPILTELLETAAVRQASLGELRLADTIFLNEL